MPKSQIDPARGRPHASKASFCEEAKTKKLTGRTQANQGGRVIDVDEWEQLGVRVAIHASLGNWQMAHFVIEDCRRSKEVEAIEKTKPIDPRFVPIAELKFADKHFGLKLASQLEKHCGITMASELAATPWEEVYKVSGFGCRAIRVLADAMRAIGIEWGEKIERPDDGGGAEWR